MQNLLLILFFSFFLVSACKLEQGESVIPSQNSVFQDSSYKNPNNKAYQDLISKYVRERKLSGINLLIRSPNQGLWQGSAGFARLEDRTLLLPTHIIYPADIACIFTATAIWQMKEENLIDLDQKIAKYLDNYASYIPNADQITVKQLLNHTSGVRDFTQTVRWVLNTANDHKQTYTSEQYLEYIKDLPASFSPNEKCSYSATNYLLLALISEKIMEQSHAQILEERIFKPLNLQRTYYKIQENYPNPDGRVNFYLDRLNDGKLENLTKMLTFQLSQMTGHEGILSTTYDVQNLLNELFKGNLIQKKTLSEMLKPVSTDSANYAFGLNYIPTIYGTAYGQTGRSFGSMAMIYYFPQSDVTVMIHVNMGAKTAFWVEQAVQDLFLETLQMVF